MQQEVCERYSTLVCILAVLAQSSFKDMKNFLTLGLILMVPVVMLAARCSSRSVTQNPDGDILRKIKDALIDLKAAVKTLRKCDIFLFCCFVLMFFFS